MSVSKAEFAWAGGDTPGETSFSREVASPAKDAIIDAIGEQFPPALTFDARLFALCRLDEFAGRYKLLTRHGEWFVRVSSRFGSPELEQAIVSHIHQNGASVNPIIVAGIEADWRGRTYRVDVRPLVNGRHFDSSDFDLRSLATVLSDCHRILASFNRSDDVKAAAASRNDQLSRLTGQIADAVKDCDFSIFAERAAWASQNRGWLEELADCFDPRPDLRPDSQCVHGELHRGNALFDKSSGNAILVDFEESPSLFMPTAWDLAFMFQRFCLWDNPSHNVMLDRLEVIARSYGKPLPKLAPMMSQIAWFTVVSILDLRVSSGIITPAEEYDKFVRLQRQGRQFEGIL